MVRRRMLNGCLAAARAQLHHQQRQSEPQQDHPVSLRREAQPAHQQCPARSCCRQAVCLQAAAARATAGPRPERCVRSRSQAGRWRRTIRPPARLRPNQRRPSRITSRSSGRCRAAQVPAPAIPEFRTADRDDSPERETAGIPIPHSPQRTGPVDLGQPDRCVGRAKWRAIALCRPAASCGRRRSASTAESAAKHTDRDGQPGHGVFQTKRRCRVIPDVNHQDPRELRPDGVLIHQCVEARCQPTLARAGSEATSRNLSSRAAARPPSGGGPGR